MSKFKLWCIIILLMSVSGIAGYYAGNINSDKHYEAACLQADFIKSLMSSGSESAINGSEVEESYYEWFQDLEYGALKTKKITSVKDLDEYHMHY